MVDDRLLLEAWADGDRAAGAELFDRHYDAVARFFRNKVDDSACTDLVQSTFLACVEGVGRFRADASFRTYLFGIAHNLLRKHYQQRRVHPGPVDLDELCVADLGSSASTVARVKQEQRLLLEALRRVPTACQEVLELHYWEQMGVAEIAEVVGVPEGTVKSRLQRGRRLLDEQLQQLSTSRELLQSTVDNLDAWAADLRKRLLPGAGH